MSSNKIRATFILAIIAISTLIWLTPGAHIIENKTQPVVVVQPSNQALVLNDIQAISNEEAFIENMVARLKQKHGHEIHLVNIQATMQDFRDFVLEQFPENGLKIFTTIMNRAFPNQANDILALIEKLDEYDHWYSANLLSLNDMDPLTKKGTIWKKRHELFGSLAEVLWESELDQFEEKRQTVQATLEALNSANDMTMDERLFVLKNTLDEQYAEEQENFLMNKGLIADVYFRLDSVQQDLKNMSPDQRAEALARSRDQLGFTDEEIKRQALDDLEKEQRWNTGYEYMAARDQLVQAYEGDELNEKLDALRKKYFKQNASTIEAEENSAFFRYERPRLYGSN